MFMAGFASSIGQILVIRELLVIFYGNELSTGLILACWLLCTAVGSGLTGRILRKKPPAFRLLLTEFAILCAALPSTIVWVRAARAFWSIPSGELLSPGMMLITGFLATAPICLLSGSLFAIAWELCRAGTKGAERPIFVYLAESLGAGGGGLVFYFLLLPLYSSFAASLCLVLFMLGCSMAVGAWPKYQGRAFCLIIVAAIFISASIFFGYSDRVDFLTRRLQWEKAFVNRGTPHTTTCRFCQIRGNSRCFQTDCGFFRARTRKALNRLLIFHFSNIPIRKKYL